MKHLLLAGFALSALAVSSCSETISTHGQVILPSRLAQVETGVSTKQDVQRLLGSPSTTGTFNDNRWYYVTSTLKDKPLNPDILEKREVLIIDFDPSGTVAGISTKDQTEGKALEPDKASTVTHGQSLGIIDSIMQQVGFGAK
jgi:outer membrane protein assembly factor BamE (lipoprotein component of BamABCDE complex)